MMRGLVVRSLSLTAFTRGTLVTGMVSIDPGMIGIHALSLRIGSTLFFGGLSLLANTDSFHLLGILLGLLVVCGLVGLVLLNSRGGVVVSISATVDPRRRGCSRRTYSNQVGSVQDRLRKTNGLSNRQTHLRVGRAVRVRVDGTSWLVLAVVAGLGENDKTRSTCLLERSPIVRDVKVN